MTELVCDTATTTVNTYLSESKGVAKEAGMQKLIDVESLQHIRGGRNPRSSRLTHGLALPSDESSALLRAAGLMTSI